MHNPQFLRPLLMHRAKESAAVTVIITMRHSSWMHSPDTFFRYICPAIRRMLRIDGANPPVVGLAFPGVEIALTR